MASSRMKVRASEPECRSEWPKPSRSYATTVRPVANASCSGKPLQRATHPRESWKRRIAGRFGRLLGVAGTHLWANSEPTGVLIQCSLVAAFMSVEPISHRDRPNPASARPSTYPGI
jgi:hypothetical protein